MSAIVERQLRELESLDSAGAPVLSIYLPVRGDTPDDLLVRATRLVRGLAVDMPEAAQADLASELEVIRDYLGSLLAAPASLVLFTCSRRGLFRVFRLDHEVNAAASWALRPELGRLRQALERQAAGATGQARNAMAAGAPVN